MGPTNPEVAKDQDPACIRALFGQSTMDNAVHGSSNTEHAQKKIQELFEIQLNPDGTTLDSRETGDDNAPPDTTDN